MPQDNCTEIQKGYDEHGNLVTLQCRPLSPSWLITLYPSLVKKLLDLWQSDEVQLKFSPLEHFEYRSEQIIKDYADRIRAINAKSTFNKPHINFADEKVKSALKRAARFLSV